MLRYTVLEEAYWHTDKTATPVIICSNCYNLGPMAVSHAITFQPLLTSTQASSASQSTFSTTISTWPLASEKCFSQPGRNGISTPHSETWLLPHSDRILGKGAGWVLGESSSPEGGGHEAPQGSGHSLELPEFKKLWTLLSDTGFEFWLVLCGAKCCNQ